MVGTNIADPGVGGSKYTGLCPVLQGFVPSCPVIQVRDVAPGAPYIMNPWRIPPYSGLLTDRAKAMVTGWQGVVLTSPREGYIGGRDVDD